MKKKLITIYETNSGIIIEPAEIELPTVSLEELERAMKTIRDLIPKG